MSVQLDISNASVLRAGRRILSGASLAARGGELIGLLGPNGAGKSTLLRVCAGLEAPNEGAARIDDADIAAMPPVLRARRIAYLPQARPVFWSMTVERIVALGRFAYGAAGRLSGEDEAAVMRALAATDMTTLKDRPATALSGGEAARMHLARALASETPALLADEPTAALDPRHRLAIMKGLRARADAGGLVIAALHDLDLAAKFCTRIVMLVDGEVIADDTPMAVLTPDVLASAFGVQATVAAGASELSVSFLA